MFYSHLNPLNPDLPLWICTPDPGLPAATSSSTRRRCQIPVGSLRQFAGYRPHKSLKSLSDCLNYSISFRVSDIHCAEIIVQKLIITMKESESKNKNIPAVVDNFPKLRTTSRVSIDDCHWLSYTTRMRSIYANRPQKHLSTRTIRSWVRIHE